MKFFCGAALALLLLIPAARPQRFTFETYDRDAGLDNLAIEALLQDADGFLWAGSQSGLFQFDGRNFRKFTTSAGLPAGWVLGLHETPDGTLWVVTSDGLAYRSGDTFIPIDLGQSYKFGVGRSIASGGAGRLYLTSSLGLYVSRSTASGTEVSFEPVPPAAALNVGPAHGVAVTKDGSVWFGCGSELCRLLDGSVTVLGTADGLPADTWTAMAEDEAANLWLRSFARLYVRRAGSTRFEPAPVEVPPSRDNGAIRVDRAGRLVVPTDRGLLIRDGEEWREIGLPEGLPSEGTTDAFTDREGSFWVALRGRGLARLLGDFQWDHWTLSEGLSSEMVWSISKAADGTVWTGSDGGVSRLRADGTWLTWNRRDGLAGDRVLAVAHAPDGAVWTGNMPGGVSRVDPATGAVQTYGPAQGLTSARTMALLRDRNDGLWVSPTSGLFHAQRMSAESRFERVSLPGSDGNEGFMELQEDASGMLWVAATNGLLRFDG